MKRYFPLFLFCMSCIYIAKAQNLVPNPSFENYVSCPNGYSLIEPPTSPPSSVTNWFRPSCGSSDYFNSCSTGITSVPNNTAGYQPARTGNGYIGGYMLFDFQGACREYAEALLTTTLTAGHEYYVSFWVSLADKTPTNLSAVNTIGAYFGTGYINLFAAPQIDFVTPQIVNTANYISDTLNWVKISGTFIATGTENCIVLGNFEPFTTQTSQVITGSQASNTPYYFLDDVCVFDMAGNINVHDTAFCGLSSGAIHGKVNMQEYLWNTGATTYSINITQPGTYWVSSLGECEGWVDTFHVTATGDTVKPHLGNDTAICYGESVQLDASNATFNTYTWNTGATTSSINVNTSGTYSVTAASNCGIFSDTIKVTVKAQVPAPRALDTILCTGAGSRIELPYDQPGLLWRTSPQATGTAEQPRIDATVPGSYLLYISQQQGGCESQLAQVKVQVLNTPLARLPGDTALCDGAQISLGQPQDGVSFLWNTGATGCCIDVDTSGTYKLKTYNYCGTAEDESTVTFSDCNHCIWTANAFSPNNDGLNDRFEVRNLCPIRKYMIRIYNRYGQTVFFGDNISKKWDGTFNGKSCDASTYYYYLEAEAEQAGAPKIKIKGDLILIR